MIEAGTLVAIRTTNGGEITARLYSQHRYTYDAVICCGLNSYAVISGYRIKSITIC